MLILKDKSRYIIVISVKKKFEILIQRKIKVKSKEINKEKLKTIKQTNSINLISKLTTN